MENIFAYIDSNKEKFLSFWEDICNIEGTAADKENIDKLSDFITAFAVNIGFAVSRIPFENCGDYLVIDTNPDSEKGCAFMAHTDTVHPIGAFGVPAVKRDSNCIYGPGVVDCKGGIAIALLAMKALSVNGYNKNLRLLLTTDEEVSNRLSGEKGIEAIKSAVAGYKSAFNCEVGREGEAVVSRKGILRAVIKIKGISAHSGIDYANGVSAVREAAYKIIELESKSDTENITYNCGIIKGGTRPNIVPDECEITVDVRVRDEKGMRQAEKTLVDVTERSFVDGTFSTIEFISRRDAFLRNSDTERLFRFMRSVSEEYGLGELKPIESGGGSDSAYSQSAGVPSICAVGACGDYCHTLREFAYIKSLAERAKLLSATVVALGHGLKGYAYK